MVNSYVPSKPQLKLGTVAQVCNPSYQGSRDEEDHSLKTTRAKRTQDPISTHGWTQSRIAIISIMQESINRRIAVQAGPGIKLDPISKITIAKRAGA
jgi:hypothetical protein